MSDHNMTIAGFGGYGRHREARVKKVENGFEMNVKVSRKSKDPDDPHKFYNRVDEETYVFYTLPELLIALETYFEAPKEDLKR